MERVQMTTIAPTADAPAAAVTAPVVPASKPPKSYSVKLVGPEGSTSEALILVYWTKSAGWRLEVTTYTEKAAKGVKRTGTRGATVSVASLAAGRKKADEVAAAMVKGGWVKPEAKPIGLERKEDAFTLDNLPAPILAAPVARPAGRKK
jgi:hypothetical protein